MCRISQLKQSIKRQDTPLKRAIYRLLKGVMQAHVPPVPALHLPIYSAIRLVSYIFFRFIKLTYWQPVFMCWLANRPKRLFLYGRGLPYVTRPLMITIGDDCRIATQITISGRTAGSGTPSLEIGDNVDIGWGTGLYVGTRIIIGDNVRIAGQGTLAGYPGHPLDARRRARGEAEDDHQARDIVLEDDVWLARHVVVNAGVTIGQGTVVAAGSVVTKDLPAGVLAGGVPARVIKAIDPVDDDCESLSATLAA